MGSSSAVKFVVTGQYDEVHAAIRNILIFVSWFLFIVCFELCITCVYASVWVLAMVSFIVCQITMCGAKFFSWSIVKL